MNALPRTALRDRRHQECLDVFAADVLAGLGAEPKRLSAKYFYDSAGSLLFEEITRLPEYYPTRTEIGILEDKAAEISALLPRGAALVEFGSGSTQKVRTLLRASPQIAAYVPVDISADYLAEESRGLERDVPRLAVLPVAADFTRPFELPSSLRGRRVGFFPGSTIGNFEPVEAAAFLRLAADVLGPGARMIVGVDLVKDRDVLHAAYNDAAGVTARFNLNLLVRINRELGADFDLAAFRHRAFFNEKLRRIEMHLESLTEQTVRVAGRSFAFRAGETIHTENSYKYDPDTFRALAQAAGWRAIALWTDAREHFSVHALELG
jgi:dimethylhistidine N-methyltransferase